MATFEYDARALPKTVKWVRSGQAPKTVATQSTTSPATLRVWDDLARRPNKWVEAMRL